MSSRLLRWVVIVFTCTWFGVLVPVHTRGQIKLAGSRSITPVAVAGAQPTTSHCSKGGHCHKMATPTPAKPGEQKPPVPEDDASDCAVCHLILGLITPPPVTTYEVYLGLVRYLPADRAEIAPLRHAALPFHGLDPPTV